VPNHLIETRYVSVISLTGFTPVGSTMTTWTNRVCLEHFVRQRIVTEHVQR
jgi:hypothetical protein